MKKLIWKFSILFVIAICLANTMLSAQSRKKPRSWTARLDSTKPTLYITFKNIANNEVTTGSNGQMVRLELHNNTRWTVLCYLTPGAANTGDAHITYKVENVEAGKTMYRDTGDVVFPRSIKSGESVTFLVSSTHLAKGNRIFVEFNYEWEKRDRMSPYAVEPSHRVYFYHNDLPDSLR